MVMPSLASRTAVRSVRVSAITRLEPPANTSSGSLSPLRVCGVQLPQHGDHLFGAGAGDQAARDRSDPQRGQRRQRHRIGDMRTGEQRTGIAAFMARNGSLTSYAAFIRLVRRLRGQRRRGSSGFHRGGLLAGQAGRIPASTTRSWSRCESVVSPATTAPSRWSPCRWCTATTCRAWSPSCTGATSASGARRAGDRSPTAPRRRPSAGSIVDAPVNVSGTAVLSPLARRRRRPAGIPAHRPGPYPADRRQVGEHHRHPSGQSGEAGTTLHHGVAHQQAA